MRTMKIDRSPVGASVSSGPQVRAETPTSDLPRGDRRVRRGVVGAVAVTVAVATALSAAGGLPSGSDAGSTSTGSGPTPVVAGSWCYLPKGEHALSPAGAQGPSGEPTPSRPGEPPRIPALYGLEQVAAHTFCK